MKKKLRVKNPDLIEFYLFEMSYWFFGAWEKQNFVHQVNFVLFEIFKFELLEFAVSGHEEIQKSEGFAEGWIHVIFDTIVRSAREMLGNSRPSIAKKVMELNKRFFLFVCPKVIFRDRGVELIKPSKNIHFANTFIGTVFLTDWNQYDGRLILMR